MDLFRISDLRSQISDIGFRASCFCSGSVGCGSTAPDLLQLTVPGVRANVGVALDGDGDRLVMVDHFGRILDGDQLLYIIATARKKDGSLKGPVVAR